MAAATAVGTAPVTRAYHERHHDSPFSTATVPWPIDRLLEWIRVAGVDHTTLASDVGQLTNPTAVGTYTRVVTLLLKAGVPIPDITKMISANPSALLGIS